MRKASGFHPTTSFLSVSMPVFYFFSFYSFKHKEELKKKWAWESQQVREPSLSTETPSALAGRHGFLNEQQGSHSGPAVNRVTEETEEEREGKRQEREDRKGGGGEGNTKEKRGRGKTGKEERRGGKGREKEGREREMGRKKKEQGVVKKEERKHSMKGRRKRKEGSEHVITEELGVETAVMPGRPDLWSRILGDF